MLCQPVSTCPRAPHDQDTTSRPNLAAWKIESSWYYPVTRTPLLRLRAQTPNAAMALTAFAKGDEFASPENDLSHDEGLPSGLRGLGRLVA